MPLSYAIVLQQFQSLAICTNVKIGLLLTPPGGDGGASAELAAGGYARQTVSLAATGVMCASNPAPIVFTPTEAWPTCQYFGIYNLGGALLYWGMLARPVTSKGAAVTIPAGAVWVDWLNPGMDYTPDFGRLPIGNAPVAPIDTLTTLLSRMAVAADLGAADMAATEALLLHPASFGSVARKGLLGSPNMGNLKPCRMMDATRGTGAGFTVSAPDGLAF